MRGKASSHKVGKAVAPRVRAHFVPREEKRIDIYLFLIVNHVMMSKFWTALELSHSTIIAEFISIATKSCPPT